VGNLVVWTRPERGTLTSAHDSLAYILSHGDARLLGMVGNRSSSWTVVFSAKILVRKKLGRQLPIHHQPNLHFYLHFLMSIYRKMHEYPLSNTDGSLLIMV
jgi:hypothetical protein